MGEMGRGSWPRVAALAGAGVLALAGLFFAMGGAVRWLGCFDPASWASGCPMHDDWYSYIPGIGEPVGLGSILLAPAVVLLALAVRDRLVTLATLLVLPGYVSLGLTSLLPLGPAAKGA